MTVKILKNVRIAFVDALWTPKEYEGDGKPKYRTNFLMAPDSEAKKVADAGIKEAALSAKTWAAKAQEVLKAAKAAGKICLIDGNTKTYNGYEGNFALTATRSIADGAPKVVGLDGKTPISETAGKIYSGCYVNAKVDFWPQDNKFGKTVRCTLIAVQFVRDGESFGGAAPASAEGMDDLSFEEDTDENFDDFEV
jgi:hypothetical protein